MSRTIKVLPVGRLAYIKGCKLQDFVSAEVRNKQLPQTLVIVEHDPVYTVGLREKLYSAEEENKLLQLGAEFYRTNRGGLITFHGPGQMVVYPIIDLRNFQPSIRWYVNRLEKTVIDVCAAFGVTAYTTPHTGVWTNDMKICAMGIHASRYITTHGLALNCNTNLKWFSYIVPCGIIGKTVTSLSQELQRDVSVDETIPILKDSFSTMFDCHIEDYRVDETKDILSKAQI